MGKDNAMTNYLEHAHDAHSPHLSRYTLRPRTHHTFEFLALLTSPRIPYSYPQENGNRERTIGMS
jgi:hypothetical protein